MGNILVGLYVIELFFGFNGKMLLIGGISVRHCLFFMIFIYMTAKMLLNVRIRVNEHKNNGVSLKEALLKEFKVYTRFDIIFLVFILLHMIWIVFIPAIQNINEPGKLAKALSSGASIIIAFLYFPVVYMVRIGKIKMDKCRKLVISCCVILALLHIFIYIAECLQWENDHSVYFMERFFGFWNGLVNGKCDINSVVMPFYSVRVIYTFNVFILMSFYFIVGKKGKRYIVWTVLNIVALFTTGTRSLIVGVLCGVIAYLIIECAVYKLSLIKIKRWLKQGIILTIVALCIDSMMFQGMNITRLMSSFSYSAEVVKAGEPKELRWASESYSKQNEIRGTTNSNSTRILQIKVCIEQFLAKPLFGHGFAIDDADMQGVVFVCRVGLAGVVLWISFLGILTRRIILLEKIREKASLPAIYLVVSVLVSVIFIAMWGSFTMSAAVFMLLELAQIERENKIQLTQNEVRENVR